MDCDELLLIQRKIYSSKYYGISHRSNPIILYGANIGFFLPAIPQNSLWQQIMLFCTAFGIAYGIQLLFVILMIEAIGIKEFTAQFIGIIIYGAVNFMVNNRITFR